ncbi:hypothetical protein [uncultured Thiodictyon sp.]|uniref:hypothetical protein n=1 Tax=uncultured Thiodictyon sp. TaxID=1846217 RepID=UPI0025EF758F|nr:hypothetical protein [uncultured Thiodictyon sp.]
MDSNHVVLRYRCDARGENQCLAPTPISDTALIGLIQYTKKVLVGDPQSGQDAAPARLAPGADGVLR